MLFSSPHCIILAKFSMPKRDTSGGTSPSVGWHIMIFMPFSPHTLTHSSVRWRIYSLSGHIVQRAFMRSNCEWTFSISSPKFRTISYYVYFSPSEKPSITPSKPFSFISLIRSSKGILKVKSANIQRFNLFSSLPKTAAELLCRRENLVFERMEWCRDLSSTIDELGR